MDSVKRAQNVLREGSDLQPMASERSGACGNNVAKLGWTGGARSDGDLTQHSDGDSTHFRPASMLASLRMRRRLSSFTKVRKCRAKRNLRINCVRLSDPTICDVFSIKSLMSAAKFVFAT